ncbi:UNVERIFIED_CONTAM: ABC-type uncharacterized transport system ATPase component [Paenibacillus sp. PvR008]
MMMKRIKDELKKGEKLIMLQDMSVYDINQKLDKLRKEWAKIDNQIDTFENMKNRKLSEEFKGYYTNEKDWRDLGDRPVVRY